MPVLDSPEALAVRQEANRFESLCTDIQALFSLLEQVDNVPLKRKMRELVNRLEGAYLLWFHVHLKSLPRDRRSVGIQGVVSVTAERLILAEVVAHTPGFSPRLLDHRETPHDVATYNSPYNCEEFRKSYEFHIATLKKQQLVCR